MGVYGHCPVNDLGYMGGDRGYDCVYRNQGIELPVTYVRHSREGVNRYHAGHQGIKRGTQPVDIRPHINASVVLFWGPISGRAGMNGSRWQVWVISLNQTKIHEHSPCL